MKAQAEVLQVQANILRTRAKALRSEADMLDGQADTLDALAISLGDDPKEASGSDPKDHAPTPLPSLDQLRQLKAKNVSWVILRRGAMSEMGQEVTGKHLAYDRHKARHICNSARITFQELIQVLDEAGVGYEN